MTAPALELLYFAIVAAASTIGAIAGIGGGIIIKPLIDSLGAMGVSTASFLSGCTVLAMASVSLLLTFGRVEGGRAGDRAEDHGEARGQAGIPAQAPALRLGTSLFLALGAVAGGVGGKELFTLAITLSSGGERVGLVQAVLLLAVNIGVFLYMAFKDRFRARKVAGAPASLVIGAGLGALSSFLGIGGGPINIAALRHFHSMGSREAALNSLFVIFCSQAASLAASLATRSVPAFAPETLAVMCLGGIAGALAGRRVASRLSERATERFFIVVLACLVALNVYNITRFAGN